MKTLVFLLSMFLFSGPLFAQNFAQKLVQAAAGQIGVTTVYNPAYVRLSYPKGDVARHKGVCTDVVIRALRDAADLDLQVLVHQDMKANFARYPRNWGLKRTDRNIDHRRVPNLRRYFERKGFDLPVTTNKLDYAPGDIVSWNLPGNLTHIGIVSDMVAADGTPLIIHNIGQGTQQENILFAFEITGHYRLPGAGG